MNSRSPVYCAAPCLINTARRPTERASLCAHVFNTTPVDAFPTVSTVHDSSRVLLVASAPVQPVGQLGHVLSHMINFNGESAFNNVHVSGLSKHSCIEVQPEDIRVCLSQISRAFNKDPLNTSVSIAVPRKHACRNLWLPYLQDYTLLKSEKRVFSENVNASKIVDI